MLDDELKRLWQQASHEEVVRYNKTRLLDDLNKELKRMEKGLRNRDIREVVAAIAIVPAFGFIAYVKGDIFLIIGAILLVLTCLLIIYSLNRARKYEPKGLDTSLRDYLQQQKTFVDQQAKLLQNVLYWYILPLFVSMLFIVRGLSHEISAYAIMVFLAIGLYYLNREALKKDLVPLQEKLKAALEELEE
ncbi:hypothetical protein [Pontibacter sp. SGAir0037]|uniref:hypothetical protein n=1 Tax=Pontibacter sp. SGAir0037 TaxID=2571030 RepID=UPI0010CCF16F|nr:hypothetical protein [Pontibacter sp. SGAir0037]QCR21256.1 hypothetical protein C1N53_02080 [Pontibacter sp. SGAir0037]